MEFFNQSKAVRLQSHLGKYLFADSDQESVHQSRNCSTRQVRWTVELVENNPHVIRLKSCYGKYLTASDEVSAVLLGMTRKKVSQKIPKSEGESGIEWEPRKDGFYVKLRTKGGKYLRANGGTPPWRNSITYDVPHRTATLDWVLWCVEAVDTEVEDDDDGDSVMGGYVSSSSSFSSFSGGEFEEFTSSPSMTSSLSLSVFGRDQSAMELFQKAKAVRLRSHHDKYLLAEDDQESVSQDRNGSIKNAKWTVEIVEHSNVLRFKSCYGKYLTASNMPFRLSMTGKKVLQTLPKRLDSSVEWEPIREGFQVRLKTRYGQYLRANGGVPPWRNSITHDIPHRTTTQDWILWDVDVVEIRVQSPKRQPLPLPEPASPPEVESSHHFSRQESSNSMEGASSAVKSEGRIIHYEVANERGEVKEENESLSFTFKGNGVEELKQKLREETGLNEIVVCSRNILNGKLYPLRLHLPPNNTDMHVVVVPSS